MLLNLSQACHTYVSKGHRHVNSYEGIGILVYLDIISCFLLRQSLNDYFLDIVLAMSGGTRHLDIFTGHCMKQTYGLSAQPRQLSSK